MRVAPAFRRLQFAKQHLCICTLFADIVFVMSFLKEILLERMERIWTQILAPHNIHARPFYLILLEDQSPAKLVQGINIWVQMTLRHIAYKQSVHVDEPRHKKMTQLDAIGTLHMTPNPCEQHRPCIGASISSHAILSPGVKCSSKCKTKLQSIHKIALAWFNPKVSHSILSLWRGKFLC